MFVRSTRRNTPPPARCLPHDTCEHSAIQSRVTMPSSSPDPLWKPLLLSGVAYTSETVAWQIPQLNMSSGSVRLCTEEESLLSSTGDIAAVRLCCWSHREARLEYPWSRRENCAHSWKPPQAVVAPSSCARTTNLGNLRDAAYASLSKVLREISYEQKNLLDINSSLIYVHPELRESSHRLDKRPARVAATLS
jgi:hypothetical protein